ncbi:MAG: hypothetical protein IKK91_05080 [Ruminococcus sp.]|nr:hypothetical protein [Ruminococcus sp.]
MKVKNLITVITMAVLVFGMSFWCWFRKPEDFSGSERRVLKTFPELSAETIVDASFMNSFEDYAMDQFPMRDMFRGFKSAAELFVFQKLDNNDLYLQDGYIAKVEYPQNDKMIDHAAGRFRYIYDTYLSGTDTNVYMSVIPDKNCFLSDKRNRLSLDYPEFIKSVRSQTDDFTKYIDITDLLTLSDFYRTDTHWRQEKITDVAERLASAMGASLSGTYTKKTLDKPFYGVYYNQLALPAEPDELCWMTNDTLEKCKVTSYNNKYGQPVEAQMYSMEKAEGRDAYEMFLNGSDPLVTVENPDASSDRELIIFRDSFGSSLAPLLVDGYSKVTLVDIRYISSSALSAYIDFEDQDVLFIYSTLILNNSLAMK